MLGHKEHQRAWTRREFDCCKVIGSDDYVAETTIPMRSVPKVLFRSGVAGIVVLFRGRESIECRQCTALIFISSSSSMIARRQELR